MILGVFLAIGESWRDFQKKGQDKLLLNYNLRNYSRSFEKVYVFSYENENIKLGKNIILVPNKTHLHRYLYSILLPLIHSEIVKKCDVFRGLQITGGIPGILTKLIYGKRTVINYGYPYAKFAWIEGKYIRSILYRFLETLIIAYSDRIIVTFKEGRQYIQDSSKVIFIPNGINLNIFKPLKKINKKYTILFIGRLEIQKNLIMLLEAVSKLPRSLRTVLFIGRGTYKQQLTKYAQEKKICLSIIDKIPNNQLPEYYNQAKIFVLPSIIEGNPKVLLEAMSCALPCVGNNVPGIRSIIKDKVTGLLFNNNHLSLFEVLSSLIADKKLASKMGLAAREHISGNYNYQILSIKEIKILKK